MRKSLLFFITACVFLTGISLYSCKKKDEVGPRREFMTSSAISITAGQTNALLSWKEAVNTDSASSSYTVQVSKDSLFTDGSEFTYVVPGTTLVVYDTQLTIREKYYARVKTNGANASLDSKWVYSKHFSLTGEQIFLPVRDVETKHNSVVLRWVDSTRTGLLKIVLTPANGAPSEYLLDQDDIDSSFKKIDGLAPTTVYHAQLFSATKERGFLDFTTKDVPVYAYTIDTTMDLALVLDTCAPSIIIGLDAGHYKASATYTLKGKSVTLMSVSGNPDDTRVDFREFKLAGTGAGLHLRDLSFNGGTTGAYFLNFAGLNADADAATFANVSMDNCKVDSFGNCLLRANRGTAAGDHKIGSITINNCIISNNLMTSLYTEFTLDKMAFQNLTVTNSTFYNVGRAMILMSTALPAGTAAPVIVFDKNTVNGFGGGSGPRLLLDANANPVQASFTNSIFANAPRSGTLATDMIRASAASSAVTFSNNNYFKLMNGAAIALTLPASVTQVANQQIDLTWTPTTVNFTLPAGSPLRTAASNGGAIGDPRWAQ
jgi:hypothetical protein